MLIELRFYYKDPPLKIVTRYITDSPPDISAIEECLLYLTNLRLVEAVSTYEQRHEERI